MTVAQLLGTVSARELEEWMIFERLEADDERAAYEAAGESAEAEPTEMIE
jgi:hypothetical protein